MRTWTIMVVVVLASLGRSPALAEDIEISFLQAAIFFISGREPPNFVQMSSDKKAIVREEFLTTSGARNVRYDYFLNDGEPCVVYAFLVEPPYGGKRVRFNELPSPRAMRNESGYTVMDLPKLTWCMAEGEMSEGAVKLKLDTTRCADKISFRPTGKLYRQIAALDYIRAKFCPGLPEPPPPPRMPY